MKNLMFYINKNFLFGLMFFGNVLCLWASKKNIEKKHTPHHKEEEKYEIPEKNPLGKHFMYLESKQDILSPCYEMSKKPWDCSTKIVKKISQDLPLTLKQSRIKKNSPQKSFDPLKESTMMFQDIPDFDHESLDNFSLKINIPNQNQCIKNQDIQEILKKTLVVDSPKLQDSMEESMEISIKNLKHVKNFEINNPSDNLEELFFSCQEERSCDDFEENFNKKSIIENINEKYFAPIEEIDSDDQGEQNLSFELLDISPKSNDHEEKNLYNENEVKIFENYEEVIKKIKENI